RGDLVPAYLALFTNLLIDPDGARVERTVRILSLMAEVNDEITGYAKKYKPAKQDDFQELQDIFLSKIALNRNYKLQVSLEDAIVRQFQVILEKLEYNASDKGFAMQVYVPLYTQLYQAKQLEPLVNYVFSGLKINSVQSYVKRNKKEVGAMTDNVNAYLKELRNTEILQFTQRKDAKTFYLWSDGYMAGKGPFKINNGEYDIYGLWTFYFQNGNIKSTGNLNDKGNKEGEWKFYYNSGILKDVSNYKDDALEGKSIAYYDNGILYSDEVYANNKLNGQAKYYYYNGLPKLFGFYKDGVKDGEEKGFKSTGFLSYTTHYKAGKQDGAFTSYHENGKVYVQRSYVADKAEGNYKEFNTDGVLVLEGMFKNDAKEGLWKGYHANGKIESEYTYVNGDIQGETKEYYDNGTLSGTTTYEKGKVQGLTKAFDDEGKLYSEAVYERGRLRELRFFDRTGKQVSNFSTRNGAGNIVFYDKDGNKTAEGYYTKEGLRQGKYTTYFLSGKIATEEYYKEGELEGEKIVYYKNGKVSERLNYKNGVIDGYYTSYHENGTPKYEGWVIKGDKQGPFKSFNKQGDLQMKSTI
ncbi:MAG TPA: hypothetical protein DCQ29_14185, partial [Chitinophagaceae bacterium]|nr:hypothetical protein [Chitinophagaceae bacterium]